MVQVVASHVRIYVSPFFQSSYFNAQVDTSPVGAQQFDCRGYNVSSLYVGGGQGGDSEEPTGKGIGPINSGAAEDTQPCRSRVRKTTAQGLVLNIFIVRISLVGRWFIYPTTAARKQMIGCSLEAEPSGDPGGSCR